MFDWMCSSVITLAEAQVKKGIDTALSLYRNKHIRSGKSKPPLAQSPPLEVNFSPRFKGKKGA